MPTPIDVLRVGFKKGPPKRVSSRVSEAHDLNHLLDGLVGISFDTTACVHSKANNY